MNYQFLTLAIKAFGKYQTNNRGSSKFLSNVKFNGKRLPFKYLNSNGKNEIDYFTKNADNLINKKWGKKDEKMLNQYKYLYGNYNKILENLTRDSRNVVMTNPETCVSFLGFYKKRKKLNLHVIQRSADVTLGLPYDYLQANYLLEKACEKLNMKKGKLNYRILNAHIYINNINKKIGRDKLILNGVKNG